MVLIIVAAFYAFVLLFWGLIALALVVHVWPLFLGLVIAWTYIHHRNGTTVR